MKLLCTALSFIVLCLPLGCSSGFNYSALQLSSADLIDYGTLAKENDMPPGTLIYGALRSGVGSNAEQHSQGELGQLTQALNAMQAISDKSNDVDPFVEDIKRELSQSINRKVSDAMTSVSGAEALARHMEGYVKKGSSLRGRLETLEKSMQSHSGATEFKQQSEKLIASFERLYQMGIVFAVAKSQGEASAQAGLLQGALERFKTKTLSQALFTAPGPVEIAVINTLGKLSNLRSMITQMTTTKIVGSALADAVAEVGASITSLKAACPVGAYSDAKLKPEMDKLVADAEKAKNELSTIAATFNGYERSIKESSDTSLEVLIKKGFSNEVGASLSSHKLSRETELVRFMRQLSQNKVVVLKKDRAAGEFIKALGVAVAKHNAEFYGLNVSNVYGFNAENLLKSKKLFSMADKDFQGYLESMAKKANAQKSDDDVLPIIFVLFIDDLGEEIDVAPIMRNLALGKNRLVVVTENTHRFKNKSSFASNGLDVMSGFFVAKAVVEANDSKINASLIVEPLVKLYFGLSPIARPDLISLPEAAKDMLMRLRNNANPSADEIDNAAKETLASCKDKVSVELATSSQVLFSSLSAVADQLDANKFHFLERGKTGGGVDIEGNAELRKTREDLKKLTKLKKILTEQNDREQKLQSLKSAHLAYKTKLKAALPKISDLVKDYKDNIDQAQRKAFNTLHSLEMLFNDDLCVFKNRSEYATTNKGFDGGHSDFVERVGQQKFNPDLVKNPMQLFDIQRDGRVTPKAGLSVEAKAAIGLNCFLAGRGDKGGYDSQLNFYTQVKEIRAEITKVSKDATDLAGNMTPYDLRRFSKAHFDLRERLSQDTLADIPAANDAYWGRELSIPRDASAGTEAHKASLKYGGRFYLHWLLPYATSTRPDLLPNKCDDLALPSMFIATWAPAPVKGVTEEKRTGDKKGYNSYLKRAKKGLGAADYSVINTRGFASQHVGSKLQLNANGAAKNGGIPAAMPPWINDFLPVDWDHFNKRIGFWFMSRIVAKTPTRMQKVLEDALYQKQNIDGMLKNPFARDEVFIKVLFDQTEQFIEDSNRSLIGFYALQMLDKYKQMAEELYSLKPADVNAFLAQGPATDLSRFFAEIETILGAQAKIDDIGTGNRAAVKAWWAIFLSKAIQDGIVAFAGAAPVGGTPDATLDQPGNSRWATLQGHANSILTIATALEAQIDLID